MKENLIDSQLDSQLNSQLDSQLDLQLDSPKIAYIIVLICCIILMLFSLYRNHLRINHTTVRCGVIMVLYNQPEMHKDYMCYNPYLLISFDSIRKKAIPVDIKTYLTHKIGDKICFDIKDIEYNEKEKTKQYLLLILNLTFLFSFLFLLLVIILLK